MFSKGKTVKSVAPTKIPAYFMCPITFECMNDPTITACGHMFEREAIIRWLKEV